MSEIMSRAPIKGSTTNGVIPISKKSGNVKSHFLDSKTSGEGHNIWEISKRFSCPHFRKPSFAYIGVHITRTSVLTTSLL